jgi:hypothetical protein
MSHPRERSEVLRLIEEGKVTAAEGIQLLTARRPHSSLPLINTENRWLRIHVTDVKSNLPRVNINVPLRWLDAGLRIGRNFAPELDQIDWNKILAPAQDNTTIRLLEVEELENNQRIEIVVE